MKNDSINNSKASYTKLNFMVDKGYWNFTLNSFLQIKLKADISPDINSFIKNNVKYLNKVYDTQIPISDQAKHYGSMSTVGINMKISIKDDLSWSM